MFEVFQPAGAVIGLVAGLLIGATGVGGAAFATPAMVLLLGVPAPLAIGTDAIFCLVIKLVGLHAHRRQLVTVGPYVRRFVLGSVPGAVLGALAVRWLSHMDGGEAILRRALGVLLIAAAAVSVYRVLRAEQNARPIIPLGWLTPLSAVLGFLVGLTSIGAGSLFLPVLLFSVALPFRSVVALDLTLGLILAVVIAALHLAVGQVAPALFLSLAIGGVPGVLIGARLHEYVGTRALISTAASLVAAAGIKLVL